MWGKIIIPMYRLWLNGLYGLYGPRCPLSSKRPINLISLSLSYTTSREYRCELNQCLMSSRSFFMWPCHNCLVIVMTSAIYCDSISGMQAKLVKHGDNVSKIFILSSFMDLLCPVRNKLMYVTLMTNCLCTNFSVTLLFISLIAVQLGK